MDGLDLKIFQEELLLDYKLWPIYSKDGVLQKTFCNLGARQVAQFLGCKEFDDMNLTADLMFDVMTKNVSKKWAPSTGANAQNYAYKGGLAFAAMTSYRMKEVHGHIASVTQDPLEGSGSLGHAVPFVCNIARGDPTEDLQPRNDGTATRPNYICKSSQAFPVAFGEANYFIWL